jgi:glycine hydroxymethyltransferase
MDVIAEAIDTVLKAIGTPNEAAAIETSKALVATLTKKYPLPYAS